MDKIIILASGDGEATRKVVALFNEGNRLHTDLVFTASAMPELEEVLKEHGVEMLLIN